jgi:hypothetical protein
MKKGRIKKGEMSKIKKEHNLWKTVCKRLSICKIGDVRDKKGV